MNRILLYNLLLLVIFLQCDTNNYEKEDIKTCMYGLERIRLAAFSYEDRINNYLDSVFIDSLAYSKKYVELVNEFNNNYQILKDSLNDLKCEYEEPIKSYKKSLLKFLDVNLHFTNTLFKIYRNDDNYLDENEIQKLVDYYNKYNDSTTLNRLDAFHFVYLNYNINPEEYEE